MITIYILIDHSWFKISIILYQIKYRNLQEYNFIYQPHYVTIHSSLMIFPLACLEAQFYSKIFLSFWFGEGCFYFTLTFEKYFYCILISALAIFFFQVSSNALPLSPGPHFLWWEVSCNFHLIYNVSLFYAVFKIFFLSLVFNSLTMMCLDTIFFLFTLLQNFQASWICEFTFVTVFRKFLSLFTPFSKNLFSFLNFWNLNYPLILSQLSLILCFLSFLKFFLLCNIQVEQFLLIYYQLHYFLHSVQCNFNSINWNFFKFCTFELYILLYFLSFHVSA